MNVNELVNIYNQRQKVVNKWLNTVVCFDIGEMIYKTYFSIHVLPDMIQKSKKVCLPAMNYEDWPFDDTYTQKIVHHMYLSVCNLGWSYIKNIKIDDENDIQHKIDKYYLVSQDEHSGFTFMFCYHHIKAYANRMHYYSDI